MTHRPRLRESLTPRERVRLALDHQTTDRIPIAMICGGFEGSTRPRLAEHLGVSPGEGIDRYLEQYVDVAMIGPEYRGLALGHDAEDRVEDIWGVWRRPVSHGAGVYYEIDHYPLAEVEDVSDLDKHRWPEPEWWDYSTLPDVIARETARRDYARCTMGGNPFERTWWMRGYERTLMDMIERPELFHEIMRRVTDYLAECARRTLEAAGEPIELAFGADDIATQRGLMLSLDMLREHILPYHVRLNRVVHEFGTKSMFHSDGAVMEAIPALLESGMDVLQALQFDADGMDAGEMKRLYGDRLCFEGGVSVQHTLPFGTVAEVEEEVRHLVTTLGRGGGYILGPSHAIQSGTPAGNVVAMFETAAATEMV